MQVAQQEAHRVAHAPVGIGHALEDLVRAAHLAGVVGGRHPQAQHVGAEIGHDLVGRDDIAQRLGHLAALLVHGEPVGQHALVGRALVHGLGHQQRTVEPAAMLVRPFQVHLHRCGDLRALLAHAFEAHARIGPHVHDVGDLAIIGRVAAQQLCRIQVEPGIDAALLHALRHRFDQLRRARMQLCRFRCGRTARSARPRCAGARCTSRAVSRSCRRCAAGPRPGSTAPSGCRAACWRAAPSAPWR